MAPRQVSPPRLRMAPGTMHPMTLGDRVVRALRRQVKILPFHERLDRARLRRGYRGRGPELPARLGEDMACRAPRGAGDHAGIADLPERGIEVLAVSASAWSNRGSSLSFVREALAAVEDDYRWLDSGQRLTVTHKETRTRLRILSSSPGSARWG